MKIFLLPDKWKQTDIVLIWWDPVARSVRTPIISVILWNCWDLGPPVGIALGAGRMKISPFPSLDVGEGRRGWSSTTPASPLPLVSRAAHRQQHQLPRMYRADRDQINHLRIWLCTGSSNPKSLKFSFLSAFCIFQRKEQVIFTLQAYFLQLFELSVPQVISSHMCHFSFTMLNRALIKRFAVSSWIFFRKKKSHNCKKQLPLYRKICKQQKGWLE